MNQPKYLPTRFLPKSAAVAPVARSTRNRCLLVFLAIVLNGGCSDENQVGDAQKTGANHSDPQLDYSANARRWIADEFEASTLSQQEQLDELAWFTQAAEPFRGMAISVVSETLTTHQYESET
ncbi:MAG: hypothetical protein AAF680_13540, partial [Pseudomonadota bacterium]